jgi:L-asparagine transporter-like permease
MIFDKIGFKYVAWTLNFVILTAALSVYNSCIYVNSRTLYGLALQNNAPQIFTKVTKKGVPANAQILSAFLTFTVVPLNYFLPNWFDAFQTVLRFSILCLLINWFLIVAAHINFRKQIQLENRKNIFPAPFYPYINYLSLAFIFFILIATTLFQQEMIKQILAIPVWVLIICLLHRFFKSRKLKV